MPRRKKKQDPGIKLPTITQLSSGAYHTRVQINGQRVFITKDSEEECIAEYLALKHGVMESKQKAKHKKKTLEEAVTEYIEARREFRSPATIYGYERYKKNTFQGMMQVNVFTAKDEQWQKAIKEEHRLGRSPKYIENAWSLMAASIEEATDHRPEVKLYPEEKNERPFLDHEQIDEMLGLAHMEPLCAKNIFESVIMFILDDASLNDMLNIDSEDYDPDELCNYAREILASLHLPEVEDFISELPEVDDAW